MFPVGLYICPFWPIRAVERYPGPFNSTDLANRILVIGNTVRRASGPPITDSWLTLFGCIMQYDPVAPFRFAQGVAESFGEQAALVRFDAFGVSRPVSLFRAVS